MILVYDCGRAGFGRIGRQSGHSFHVTRLAATLTFIQPELERMLRWRLSLLEGVTMAMVCRITEFEDLGDNVRLSYVDRGDETWRTTVTTDFLIGCDGANSSIREALGIELVVLAFDEWWVVVDAWQMCDTPLPSKTTQCCRPSRPATYVVAPGNLRRWELKLLPHERPDDFDDPAVLRRAMEPFVDIRRFDIWRYAAYRFATRTKAAR